MRLHDDSCDHHNNSFLKDFEGIAQKRANKKVELAIDDIALQSFPTFLGDDIPREADSESRFQL